MGKVGRALLPMVGQVIGFVIAGPLGAMIGSMIGSALAMALTPKPRGPGIKTEQVMTGGSNGRTFIVGRYATAGAKLCPDMSHGKGGKLKNGYLIKVIGLSDKAVTKLNRLIVNGEYVAVSGGVFDSSHRVMTGKYQSNGWISFHNGKQTTADGELMANYSGYPNRPWLSTSIGKGMAYAAVTFKYNDEIHKADPSLRFEVDGIALYDPRKDNTVGGSGSHRWGDESTYEFSANNIVIVYNILRGIRFEDGRVWGGTCTFDDLPLANWAAGMNVCDEIITTSTGSERRYRGGYEIDISVEEPADIIEEFLKGCSGEVTEDGGIYNVRVGPPALPVMYVTDNDFLVNRDQEYDPFPSITDSRNTLNASFPHPAEMWEKHDAPTVTNQDYVDQDDGQILTADINLPTVPYPNQVQRLMLAWLNDDRRWRRHRLTIGHFGFALQPLDVIAWTSARNGYVNKAFEIDTTTVNLFTLNNTLALREVDPADYDWSTDDELPDPVIPGLWELPESQTVEGFAVEPWSVKDADGVDRRPALRVSWTPDGAEDADLLKIQVRVLATGVLVSEMTVTNLADGQVIISEGILASTSYQVRGQYVVARPVEWTSWISVTTANILLSQKDMDFDTALQNIGESQLLPELVRPIENRLINRIIDIAHLDLYAIEAKATQIIASDKTYKGIALIASETTARVSDDYVIARRIDTVGIEIDGVSASLQTEVTTRGTADTALGQRIDTLQITVGNNITAAVYAESIVRSDQDGILAGNINQVSARLNDFNGSSDSVETIVSLINQARIDGDTALAISINQVGLRLNNFNGSGLTAETVVSNTNQARIDGDTLLASSINSVSIRLNNAGGTGVSVEQSFIAQGNSITNLNASYSVRINNNGIVTGFGLSSGAGGTSEFAILADRFLVTDPANNSTQAYPFQVVGGVVYMRNTFIQDAAIVNAKIANLTVDSAKIANLTVGTAKITDNSINQLAVANASSGNYAAGTHYLATLIATGGAGFGRADLSLNMFRTSGGANVNFWFEQYTGGSWVQLGPTMQLYVGTLYVHTSFFEYMIASNSADSLVRLVLQVPSGSVQLLAGKVMRDWRFK